MPELAFAELGFKERLKVDLFPTIWCPGCGIGTIMIQLAMVLDEMGMDETNTIIVTGIGCTGRMGSYLKHESVYTLHGRTLPVAEAIKAVRPEMHVVVVAGDGDTASIGGNHLIHAIRRNAPLTVLCNNNEIYGLTGGQTGPTTPTGTKTLSSPAGNTNTPINLQGLVRSSPHALYAKTTVYHQLHMRNAIREAIEHDGFSFVDITSQCIENNGRRIGFASANDMLNFYRKTYKRAAAGAEHLNPFEIGILTPRAEDGANGNGSATTSTPDRPDALPAQPAGPMTSATESPGAAVAAGTVQPATDDEKARRRAESQERAAVMAQLSAEVKLAVAKKEMTLTDALTQAGIPIPEWLRTGASAPSGAPVAPGEVEISATGQDPETQDQPTELDAQKAEAAVEERNLIGGTPGGNTQPAAPQTAHDAAPPALPADPKEAKRVEAQRKLALMQRLPSEVKLRVAKGEITLADALREAGIDPEAVG
ncbi:MAG TPA: thiamine pyrophosphate-dependent enzyme [Candidatus Limnocylindria bacterium]|nr:thiamine pyrophosphate-dependent enzyme [Candidatus Limnocylindria bacterium]